MIDPEDRELIERAAKSFGTTNDRLAAVARALLATAERLAKLEAALTGETTVEPEEAPALPPAATAPARKGKS